MMSKPTKKLIIPFSCPSKDRIQPFTQDMEMAAIYYLAQKERKKGEGRVLKKPEEKLAFIAKTGYPIWLVPWKGRTLIFDGLEFTNKTISINKIPDIKNFEIDIQASSKSHEAYSAALSQNSSYFQNFTGKEETIIEGLIIDTDFVQDFGECIKDAADMSKVETTKAILNPLLDESEVATSVEKLSEVRTKVENDIKNLYNSMRFLSKSSRDQVKNLHNEINKSVKEFDKKIKTLKPKVMAKIKIIKTKRDNEVTKISKNYARKLRLLHQRKLMIERRLERFSAEIERVNSDIKVCREKKDEAREFQLNQKLDEIKKKLPSLNKEFKDIEKEIINVENAKKIQVSRARSKPDDDIEKAMKSLDDIATEKEANTHLEMQDITSLEDMTSAIIKQIDAMIKEKETELNEIVTIGIQERIRNQALVYIPVYFVSYETEVSKRYIVYPPSIISSMGIKTKLRGVFGAGKMNSLISSRSQAIAALVDKIVDLAQENPVFQKEITEAGIKTCIFHNPDLKNAIKRGITKLTEEGWISENEFGFRNETESA